MVLEKKKLIVKFKEYPLIARDEVKAREQKYANRLLELKYCLNIIDDAVDKVAKMLANEMKLRKWQIYVDCDPLPEPNKPSDIHLYMMRQKIEDTNFRQRLIDWTLRIDERSVLTQNVVDMTRDNLSKTIKPEFGDNMKKVIGNYLTILDRVENFMNNDKEVAKTTQSILVDMADMKDALQNEIKTLFNCYTYRIICSGEAYMSSIDAISSEYHYTCEHFQIHIWALKSVPIRFTHTEEPRMLVNFHSLKIILHIPYSMLQHEMVIQAVHLNFDIFTEHAKSFKRDLLVPVMNFSAGMKDLPDCLYNEWMMQINLQMDVRDTLKRRYAEFEENQRLEAKKRETYKPSKRKKSPKRQASPKSKSKVKPPQAIEEDQYPEIYDEFLQKEEELFKSFLETVYGPATLQLEEHEINLKEFYILGGIYQLFYVRKPHHTDFNKFNMTWHTQEKELIVEKDLRIKLNKMPSEDSKWRPTEISLTPQILKNRVDPECPWFVLTFQLPEHLCVWGTPMACHYEEFDEEIEELKGETLESRVSRLLQKASERKFIIDGDFDVENQEKLGSQLMKARRKSFRPSSMNFFQASLSKLRIFGGSSRYQQQRIPSLHYTDGVFHVEDFYLNKPINHAQVHTIERYCVPNLLTSFKFPREYKEEELYQLQTKSKGKGGILLQKAKQREEEKVLLNAKPIFSYDKGQNYPERLIAIFPKTEPIFIANHLEGFKGGLPYEPVTFYQLVKTLTLIKRIFQFNIREILDLPSFKSPINFEVSNIKVKERKIHHRGEPKQIRKTYVKKRATRRSSSRRRSLRLGSQISSKDRKSSDTPGTIKTSTKPRQSLKESKRSLEVQPENIKPEEDSTPFVGEEHHIDDKPTTNQQTLKRSHWTTKYIRRTTFNKASQQILIETDRLGYLAFAFKRYEHFPFKYWELQPNESDPKNSVKFILDTQHVKCVLYITGTGITGYVSEPYQMYTKKIKKYLTIDEPVAHLKDLKKYFQQNNINIFAEQDARFYIEKDRYFCEKHVATEMHTYCCMAVHCTEIKFTHSPWNRLAKRRDIILEFRQCNERIENKIYARITPEEASFVEITEPCSLNLNTIKLRYTPTWRNISSYADLHQMICSTYPGAYDSRCRNPNLICSIKNLLSEIRPLSFS